jgi:hypothetical protein
LCISDQLFFIVAGKNAFLIFEKNEDGTGRRHCRRPANTKESLTLFFAHQLAAALLILTHAVLLFLTELQPGLAHSLAKCRDIVVFVQRVIGIAAFDNIFHITEKRPAVPVVDDAKTER